MGAVSQRQHQERKEQELVCLVPSCGGRRRRRLAGPGDFSRRCGCSASPQSRTLADEIKQPSHACVRAWEHKMRAGFSLRREMTCRGNGQLQKTQGTKQRAGRGPRAFRRNLSLLQTHPRSPGNIPTLFLPFLSPPTTRLCPRPHAGPHQEAQVPAEALQDKQQGAASCRDEFQFPYSRCPCGGFIPSMKQSRSSRLKR